MFQFLLGFYFLSSSMIVFLLRFFYACWQDSLGGNSKTVMIGNLQAIVKLFKNFGPVITIILEIVTHARVHTHTHTKG